MYQYPNNIHNFKILIEHNSKNMDLEKESESESESESYKSSDCKSEPKTESESNLEFDKLNEYIEYHCDNFIQKLGQYTFGLDKVIPWEESNFVFSGGLLYDIITNRFDQELMDIDLFFYGDAYSKIKTINKLLDNLDKEQYYYLIGYRGSVIYIFIQGIPRIIQLIMTNKLKPDQIINTFDLTHIMSYSDGKTIYSNPYTINQFESKKTSIKLIHKNRLIKYFERELDCEDLLLSNYNFVIDSADKEKFLKSKRERQLYNSTYNLTRYPNSFNLIDFTKLSSDENKKKNDFLDVFECTVNYNKLDNHDFKENVDMFGAFSDYFSLKPTDIVKSNCKENVNESKSLKINLDDFNLYPEKHTKNGKLLTLSNNSSIYIPCTFLSSEINLDENNTLVNDDDDDDENENKAKSKENYIKIFLEIDNLEIIEYIKYKINPKMLIENINLDWCYNKKEKVALEKSKKDILKKPNNIHLPFIESETNEKNKLIICATLFGKGISNFESINGKIIYKLEPQDKIHCLLNLSVYLNIIERTSIQYVDINLFPEYIFVK